MSILNHDEDDRERKAKLPATEGYTGLPCVQCGRIRVFLRRDGQYECEKCETINPAPPTASAHRCPFCGEMCVCAEFYDGEPCRHAEFTGCRDMAAPSEHGRDGE